MLGPSQEYIHTHTGNTSNNRLLWRGSIINQSGLKLHGLAIVAHRINPNQTPKAKDDPFSAYSYSNQTLGDTCLEIEMHRGRDLQVDRVSQLCFESTAHEDEVSDEEVFKGSRKNRVASLLKGKGTQSTDSNRSIPFSEIESHPKVKLYVDPRCSQTHNWILSQIGKREITSEGCTRDALVVTLDPTVDDRVSRQLIIFGRRFDESVIQPSTSNGIIPLQLIIGQRKPRISSRIPRPDDPMPRVMSAMLFGDDIKLDSTKSRAISTGKSKLQTLPMTTGRTKNLLIAQPIPGEADGRIQLKSNNTSLNLKESQKRSTKVIKRPARTPGRRTREHLSPLEELESDNAVNMTNSFSRKQVEKRKLDNKLPTSKKKFRTNLEPLKYNRHSLSNSRISDQKEVEEENNDDSEDDEMILNRNHFSIDRSPSPSPASFKPKPILNQTRSPSILSLSNKSFVGITDLEKQSSKSTSALQDLHSKNLNIDSPSEKVVVEVRRSNPKPSESSSYLNDNKLLIRKITSESLKIRGLHKQHSKFKELFGAVCRGVQFAMVKSPFFL